MDKSTKGYSLVVSAFSAWGILPIFWALLADIPPVVVLLHRVLWSMVLLGMVLRLQGRIGNVISLLKQSQMRQSLFLSSLFLGLNWFTYIWALGRGEFVAASLGYFICPLLIVAFGALFCRERLSPGQLAAVGILFLGVSVPVVLYGKIPWIALALAATWASYTLLRKTTPIGAVEGVFLETTLVLPFVFLVATSSVGLEQLMPNHYSVGELLLLVMAGVVTALPQLAMVSGVRHVPLKAVGVLQYLAPSLMYLVSVLYFKKVPSDAQLYTVAMVSAGIACFFGGDYLLRHFKRPRALAPVSVRTRQ